MAFFERELLGCKRNQASIHKTMTSRLFITAAAFSVVLSQAQDKSNQDIALLSNLIYQGHYLKAGSLLETMKHSSAAHDPAIQAEMYFHEGVLSFFRLGVNDAKYLFSQSLRYFEGANNPIKVAELKEWLGTCAFKTGNPFSSVALYQEAARIRNQNGLDTIPYAWNLYLTAVAMQNSWMKEKSEKLFFQSIRLINHYVSRMGYTAKGGPMSLNSIGHFQTGLVDRVDSLLDFSDFGSIT